MGSGAKSYMRKGFLIYKEMHKYFHHIRGGRLSYMTLHPIPLNFLIYEENFILFFISVLSTLFTAPLRILYTSLHLLSQHVL
jgi:hypothetical protein